MSDVARFILATQRLPGVPAAVEVVEQGLDMAKMDVKLLAKIAELIPYSIRLEKGNKEPRQINQQQQAGLDELKKLIKQLLERK